MPTITTMPTTKATTTNAKQVPVLPLTPEEVKTIKADCAIKRAEGDQHPSADETKQPAERRRPIIYPEVQAEVCHGSNALTERDAEVIMDWRSESEHQRRMMALQPGTEAGTWTYGKVFMLTDENGEKIQCYNNLDNRPFDEKWCRGLVQTLLNFQWAGQITVDGIVEYVYGKPGMKGSTLSPCPWTAPDGRTYNVGDLVQMSAGTLNGSTVGLSLTGRVETGQHSMCGLKLANQIYHSKPRGTYPHWDAYLDANKDKHNWKGREPGPVLETILVVGLSEDRRVLRTVDEVKPRSEMDLFYTSDIFVKLREKPAKRQEMSRMLAACVDLFWKRTDRQGYKTNSQVMDLVLDHPKLIKAVEHLFACNAETCIDEQSGKIVGGYMVSNLGLSAGRSACLLYLMSASASDGDEYRNGKPAPREKGLDMSRWGKALEFWEQLIGVEVKGGDKLPTFVVSPGFEPVRQALTRTEAEVGGVRVDLTGGLALASKMLVLARAWSVWVTEGRQFTELDLTEGGCLHLRYAPASEEVVNGRVVQSPATLLDDEADFGGIDVPSKEDAGSNAGPKTDEERWAAEEQVLRHRAGSDDGKVREQRDVQAAEPVAQKPRGRSKVELRIGS